LTPPSKTWRAARPATRRWWHGIESSGRKDVVRSGIPLVIASGKKQNALANILAGAEEGTLFVAQPTRLQGRKRWIAFFLHP